MITPAEPNRPPLNTAAGEHACEVLVRLVHQGEGAAVVALAAGAGALEVVDGGPLQEALDRFGGRLQITEVAGGTGWCLGAEVCGRLVGLLYACSPVDFIREFPVQHHQVLTETLIEIEILAVEEAFRGTGVGTALLQYATKFFGGGGLRLALAKIDARDQAIHRFYRRAGFTVVAPGGSCVINTPDGRAGITAGPADGPWRLAITTLGNSIGRQ
ncbi:MULTISPECIES: GNAT family N-acetyltransferase [unclassified Crossiella]|uniref:GNAT family N-acetyltransferase n=1 Tax=unclassified Crossiella TaxID=2620835 RepID=UPI001FFEE821|nr:MULTISPECIES: GNAT family N-acetyltransferase [unclassified Crossiella]MCK2245279.1 GNAT family N-acetyltransferase [Crossiella sp. S99.2]MCK2258931.1 GNAT family N-acetyltransferase [Crossiella sp. S99.1]